MTKAQQAAIVNEEIGNVRDNADVMCIGVEPTNFAIDELFGKKDESVRVTRMTRMTRMTVGGKTNEEEEDIEVPATVMKGGLCHGDLGKNLACMIWMWSSTIICYHSINIYLKYMPGNIFINQIVSGIAEIFAHICAGAFITKLTPKYTFTIAYACVIVGAGALIFQGSLEGNPTLVAAFVLFAKFGASMALCSCYISTPFLFPVLLCGTAFGICKLVGNASAISASIIVELPIPKPMMIVTGFSIISVIVSLFIKNNID